MADAISIHIGLNRVDAAHYGSERQLLGCRNDATAMYEVAVRAGFAPRLLLLDEDATAANVREAVKAAADELSSGGTFLLTFAGHGARLPDIVSAEAPGVEDEPKDGHDEAFCLFDRMMRDDEICGLLARFSEGQRVLAVVDCCHSGTVLDAIRAIRGTEPGAERFVPATRSIDQATALGIRGGHPEVYGPLEQIPVARRSDLKATVLLLAACGEGDTTPDGTPHGAFTSALLQVLANPSVASYEELHQQVGKLRPAHPPVLRPQDERTREFRRMRPFQIHAEAPSTPVSTFPEAHMSVTEDRASDVVDTLSVPPFCAQLAVPAVPLPPDLAAGRREALFTTGFLWANGTVLHFVLLPPADGTPADELQRAVVRDAFASWKALGIGLVFEEVYSPSEAELRIGFVVGDGSWSYVGRDALRIPFSERTMNFGWNLTRPGGVDTALHEIGHALGMEHEHMNSDSGIEWDEEAVYKALEGPDNFWSREKTYHNILRKLDLSSTRGSKWDKDSVMHYPFGPGLVLRPEQYRKSGIRPPGGLSAGDQAWVRLVYPPIDDANLPQLVPGRSELLAAEVGAQQDFSLEPDASREYTVRTFGACDTTLTLFEADAVTDGDVPENAWRFLAADDDGGEERNAQLRYKLLKGRRYRVRVRVRYADASRPAALMLW